MPIIPRPAENRTSVRRLRHFGVQRLSPGAGDATALVPTPTGCAVGVAAIAYQGIGLWEAASAADKRGADDVERCVPGQERSWVKKEARCFREHCPASERGAERERSDVSTLRQARKRCHGMSWRRSRRPLITRCRYALQSHLSQPRRRGYIIE